MKRYVTNCDVIFNGVVYKPVHGVVEVPDGAELPLPRMPDEKADEPKRTRRKE
mgnify:CR=1 FL=1